jgi:hypothetical protein
METVATRPLAIWAARVSAAMNVTEDIGIPPGGRELQRQLPFRSQVLIY